MLLKSIILLASSSLALFMFAVFYLRGKKTRLLYSHLACHILVFIWLTGQLLETYAPDLPSKWVIVCFEYAPICFLGLAWLVLSLAYTSQPATKKWRLIIPLTVLQATFYALMLTNQMHHLYFQEFSYEYRVYGSLFWLNVAASYIYIFTGSVLLIGSCWNKADCEKKQSFLLVTAGLIPLAANGLYVFRIIDPGFDITPLSFSLSLLLLALATFKYRLLNIMPLALRRVFDTLEEAVIVLDKKGIIVESNKSFKEIFQKYCADDLCYDLEGILAALNKNERKGCEKNARAVGVLPGNKSPENAEMYWSAENDEIYLTLPENRYWRVNSMPILEGDYHAGRLVTFTEITAYRDLLEELKGKNVQLQEYACMAEKLAEMRERGRIARELHDTLAYEIFVMGNLMSESKKQYQQNPAEGEQLLLRGIRIANEGMKEIRRLVQGLGIGPLEKGDLRAALLELVADTQKMGTLVEVTVGGERYCPAGRLYSESIYRICQEAITNSIRHGRAKKVRIMLEFRPRRIKLTIRDDGQGCATFEKGMGLTGMEERVKRLQGRIEYGPAKDGGFFIDVQIAGHEGRMDEEQVND